MDEIARAFAGVQLATLAEEPPRGPKWAFELKFDGYRIVAMKSGANVRLSSRRDQDWTAQLQPITAAIAKLRVRELVLDGEV
ncbi:MAG TPA: hypothetical protein VGH87_22630, partial [Polyangiaceae bacterium]